MVEADKIRRAQVGMFHTPQSKQETEKLLCSLNGADIAVAMILMNGAMEFAALIAEDNEEAWDKSEEDE